jgi:hypothetical protein
MHAVWAGPNLGSMARRSSGKARQVKFRDGVRFGAGIAIPMEPPKAGEPQPNPRWIHTATEGVYSGYPGGGADITREMLDQIVRNFKSDPRFKIGPAGVGTGRVIPFDVAHISEMDPRVGDPLANEEAMAWGVDVQIKNGADGKAQLWTLAELGTEIRTAIEANPPKVNYVSIAFTPTATDPHTNAPIGALMTSVAFTNKPFIRELTPLAASTEAAQFLGRYCEPAGTPEEAVGEIRALLNLPLATAPAEVLSNVERIIGWALGGGAPPGVDAGDVVEDLRTILSIPVATPADQILTQVRSVFQQLGTQSTPPVGAMSMNPTLLRLFTMFNLVAQAEGAENALLSRAESDHVAMGKLSDFLKVAGFSDLESLAAQWPELLKAKERADKAEKELSDKTAKLAGYEAQEQTAEVAAVMSVHKMPEVCKDSLLLHLQTNATTFRAKYPLPDATRKHLLSTFAAGRTGEVEPPAGGTQPVVIGGSSQSVPADAIDLRTFNGRNHIEKAAAYLESKDASFAKLSWNEQVKRAGAFCRDNHAKIITA